jgi:NAD(P)-dependent dehydrogenase (short-subunit alcohol dehydrogenase family)
MSYADFDLTGQIAIVTGAGRGLGRGMAMALAEAGAAVVVADRSKAGVDETADMIDKCGRAAYPIMFDAVRGDDCRRLVAETVALHGRLDTFVVSHGVTQHGPAIEIEEPQWQETLSINLTGVFLCAQAAGRQMIAQGHGGSIVLISSTASTVGFDKLAAYGTSKGGVDQLCRQLAVEWGPYNIRVNAVNPGYTSNEMAGTKTPHTDPHHIDEVKQMTPLGRRATVAEIAGPVVFLASNAASFISGVCLAVDGGYCAR